MQHPDRRREYGGRDEATRRNVGSALAPFRVPQLGARPVVHRLGMEDHVRDHPVGPLAAQERAHLGPSALGRGTGEADHDEGGVPVPLPRIEPLRRLDELAGVVQLEYRERVVGEGHESVPIVAGSAPDRWTSCVVRT